MTKIEIVTKLHDIHDDIFILGNIKIAQQNLKKLIKDIYADCDLSEVSSSFCDLFDSKNCDVYNKIGYNACINCTRNKQNNSDK